jgi:1-acyl-sn-glycerol-3-phosphate acyltransferase
MNLSYAIGKQLFSELAHGLFDFRIVNESGLHFDGPALICSNHASFLDPPFIGQAFPDAIHFFARKTLFNNPLVGKVLRSWQSIPIDRDKPDPSSLKTTIRLLKSGGRVLMFPEGTRTFDGNLLPAEPGVGLFIAKAAAPRSLHAKALAGLQLNAAIGRHLFLVGLSPYPLFPDTLSNAKVCSPPRVGRVVYVAAF